MDGIPAGSTAQCDAHFAFSIGREQYLTFLVDFDGSSSNMEGRTGIFMYPNGDGTNGIQSGNAWNIMSNISNYGSTNAKSALCGGDVNNCYRLTTSFNGNNFPINFTFTNNDISNTFRFKFESPTFSGNNALQAEFNAAVDVNKDFILYLSPDPSWRRETIKINTFIVNSYVIICV